MRQDSSAANFILLPNIFPLQTDAYLSGVPAYLPLVSAYLPRVSVYLPIGLAYLPLESASTYICPFGD